MPIHDWTRVRANRFHDFHQDWTIEIRRVLNAGLLPPGYVALAEQITGGPEPDVVTLSLPIKPGDGAAGGVALAEVAPRYRVRTEADATRYARKANRVTIHHPDGDVIAVLEKALSARGHFYGVLEEWDKAAAGVHWRKLVLAMAYHRLGRSPEARQLLEEVTQWTEQTAREKLSWAYRLDLQLLLRETERFLKTDTGGKSQK